MGKPADHPGTADEGVAVRAVGTGPGSPSGTAEFGKRDHPGSGQAGPVEIGQMGPLQSASGTTAGSGKREHVPGDGHPPGHQRPTEEA